jgi:hypothetical protein
MRMFPAKRSEWGDFLLLPFKVYLILVPFCLPASSWVHSQKLWVGNAFLYVTGGCILSLGVFLVVTFVRLIIENSGLLRSFLWSLLGFWDLWLCLPTLASA